MRRRSGTACARRHAVFRFQLYHSGRWEQTTDAAVGCSHVRSCSEAASPYLAREVTARLVVSSHTGRGTLLRPLPPRGGVAMSRDPASSRACATRPSGQLCGASPSRGLRHSSGAPIRFPAARNPQPVVLPLLASRSLLEQDRFPPSEESEPQSDAEVMTNLPASHLPASRLPNCYLRTAWSNGLPARPAIRFSTEMRAISRRVSTVALPR